MQRVFDAVPELHQAAPVIGVAPQADTGGTAGSERRIEDTPNAAPADVAPVVPANVRAVAEPPPIPEVPTPAVQVACTLAARAATAAPLPAPNWDDLEIPDFLDRRKGGPTS
jgi:hypothetical protein